MKTKHTPGPWHLSAYRGKPDYDLIWDKSDRVVCQMFDKYEDNFTNYEANAKLIAAAPELLDACINSFKTLIAIGCTMEAEIMQQLESVIKKATV